FLWWFSPNREQPRRGGAADHTGDSDRDLTKRRRRDAAERDRTDTNLSPEIEIAPRIRSLGLQLLDGSKRVLADRRELHGIGGLDHLGKRRLDRGRLPRQFGAKKLAQVAVTHRIARQRIARHAADGELVDGVAAP